MFSHRTAAYRTLIMSSIFMMLRTVSDARLMALVVTSRGCNTLSSRMFVIAPLRKKLCTIAARMQD